MPKRSVPEDGRRCQRRKVDGMQCWVVDVEGAENEVIVGHEDTVGDLRESIGGMMEWHQLCHAGEVLDDPAVMVADLGVLSGERFEVRYTPRHLARDALRHKYKIRAKPNALKVAIQQDDLDLVKCLVTAGVDPMDYEVDHTISADGNSSEHEGSSSSDSSSEKTRTSDLSLSEGGMIEVDAQSSSSGVSFMVQCSPFVTAASHGKLKIIQYFLEECSLRVGDDSINDALILSVRNKHDGVTEYLIKTSPGVVAALARHRRHTLDIVAVKSDNLEVLKMFLHHSSEVSEEGYARLVALAMTRRSLACYDYLLQQPTPLSFDSFAANRVLLHRYQRDAEPQLFTALQSLITKTGHSLSPQGASVKFLHWLTLAMASPATMRAMIASGLRATDLMPDGRSICDLCAADNYIPPPDVRELFEAEGLHFTPEQMTQARRSREETSP